MDIFDRYQAIDVDAHVTEPGDLWTARVPRKWQDQVPQIKRVGGRDFWHVNGKRLISPGMVSMAGFDGRPPLEFPQTWEAIDPSAHDASARLAYMDQEGIHAQVLYPNVGGFGSQAFLRLEDPALKLACVRAYNDFLSEWASADIDRLLPVTALPFWDVAASVKEIERCAQVGHRSVLFPSQPNDFGFPSLSTPHWDPIWSVAQEIGTPISFHIGGQAILGVKDGEEFAASLSESADPGNKERAIRAQFARVSALSFVGNALGLSEIICGGICQRFPRLNFVSVESAAGWVPTFIEALDWQWQNAGLHLPGSGLELLPSEYFKRQIYACFWFERDMLQRAVELYPDNLMWESDFPHPTSMSAGPATIATHPRQYAAQALAGLDEATVRKVVQDNARRVYLARD